jgi:hypothetical protein
MIVPKLPPFDRAILAAGVRWLLRTDQPATAVLQHHGPSRRGTDLDYSFCPIGPPHMPVVAVTDRTLNEPSPDLMKTVAAELTRLGAAVSRQWVGGAQAMLWASSGLAVPAHPSLVAAVDRYHGGCPKHQTVFCSREVPACSWYRDGNALVREPLWPVRRPDGRIYRPRKIVAHAIEEDFEITRVLVTGTHDEQRAYRLAKKLIEDEVGHGVEPVNPGRGWWRDGMEHGNPCWVADDDRGAAGVLFCKFKSIPPAEPETGIGSRSNPIGDHR